MPSGRTHDRITLWSLPVVTGCSVLVTRSGNLTLMIAGGFLFSGLMFGPDLDIYSVQFQRWGKLRFLWLPYQKLFCHRSWFSHGFLIGTILRILYLVLVLFLCAIPLVAIAQLAFGFDWNWQTGLKNSLLSLKNDYPQETLSLLLGLELGAMSHSLSDWLGSKYKTSNKNVRKKVNRRDNQRQKKQVITSGRRNQRK